MLLISWLGEEIIAVFLLSAKWVVPLFLGDVVLLVDLIFTVLPIIIAAIVIIGTCLFAICLLCVVAFIGSACSVTELILIVDNLPDLVHSARSIRVCRLIWQPGVYHWILAVPKLLPTVGHIRPVGGLLRASVDSKCVIRHCTCRV